MSCNTIILQNRNYPPAVPGELVGDDGPGQARHGDVPDHPEGGQQAESAASLGAGLELCEICPDQRNAAAHSSEVKRSDINYCSLGGVRPTPVH